jgi:hypothetical protein
VNFMDGTMTDDGRVEIEEHSDGPATRRIGG